MNSSEVKDRLLELAHMRLAKRWGAFEDFRNMLDYTSEGMKLLAQAQLFPLTIGTIAFQVGGTSRLNEHLLGLIDAWAEKQPVLHVEALPPVPLKPVPQVSKAPAPINPVRGASLPPSRSPQPGKWQMWSKMPTCALWEAVCLTYDIEPDGERHDMSHWLESRRGVPYGFPADFADRLRVAQANVSTKGPIEPLELCVGVLENPRAKVRLSDVARFALECGWQIPDAMRTLADPVEVEAKAEQDRRKARELAAMRVPGDVGMSPRAQWPSNDAPPDPQAGPVVVELAATWTLRKPERFQGYAMPLYSFLRAAHVAGQARPSARDLLEAWRENPPSEVAKVMVDSFDYYDAIGDTKEANLDAIRKAIDRMTGRPARQADD